MSDPTRLIYEQLYRPTEPNDPLPDPDTNSTTRRLWATAGRIRDALIAAGKLADPDHDARVRAEVAEEIAADLEAMRPMRPQRYNDAVVRRIDAAYRARARAHATTEEPTNAD